MRARCASGITAGHINCRAQSRGVGACDIWDDNVWSGGNFDAIS